MTESSLRVGLLDRLFVREDIDGNGRCPTYLHRWTVFQPRRPRWFWRGFGVYLHKFVGDDWSLDMHDHPKRFISIGLSGSYREETPTADWFESDDDVVERIDTVYHAPWIRTFPAHHIHRIALMGGRPCWTLVIVLRHVREWGFWHRGMFMHWRNYVQPGNRIADERKACR
jgi:hypothetical protein